MSGLESKPSFKARALEIGTDAGFLNELMTAGIDSFGKLAFICSSNPHSGDDTALVTAVTDILGNAPDSVHMISLRRLWFEAHAYALADLKSKTEGVQSDTVKSMPLPERMARIEQQKTRLPGVIFDVHHEPSHHLVDKVQAMVDDGVLVYLAPSKCTSRSHEVQSDKTALHVQFDQSGNLKVAKREADLSCDTSGELQLRMAMTRRSLAFDQSGLASFAVQELWHSHLITALLRPPPAGHRFITVQQILTADKELWQLMSQESRGTLKVTPGEAPPLDALFTRYMHSAQIACFMNPLPASSAPKHDIDKAPTKGEHGDKRQADPKKNPLKRKQPGGGETIKQMLANLPQNCSSKLPNGRFICLRYNKGTCPNQKASKCKFGLHVCYHTGCGKNVPYIECQH